MSIYSKKTLVWLNKVNEKLYKALLLMDVVILVDKVKYVSMVTKVNESLLSSIVALKRAFVVGYPVDE